MKIYRALLLSFTFLFMLLLQACDSSTPVVKPWHDYQSPDQSFSVSFPDNYEAESRSISLPNQSDMKVFLIFSKKNRKVYILFYLEYEQDVQQELAGRDLFELAIKNNFIGRDATVSNVETVFSGAHTGKEAKVTVKDGRGSGIMRYFVVKNRVYYLAVMQPSNNQNQADMDRFKASFKIK